MQSRCSPASANPCNNLIGLCDSLSKYIAALWPPSFPLPSLGMPISQLPCLQAGLASSLYHLSCVTRLCSLSLPTVSQSRPHVLLLLLGLLLSQYQIVSQSFYLKQDRCDC